MVGQYHQDVQRDAVFFRREANAEFYDIVDVSVWTQHESAFGDTASCHEGLARNDLARRGHALVIGPSVAMLLIATEKLQPGTVFRGFPKVFQTVLPPTYREFFRTVRGENSPTTALLAYRFCGLREPAPVQFALPFIVRHKNHPRTMT